MKPPRDKFDLDAVAALAGVDGATLRPLLPDLLAWLQDANWPIAAPLADVLRPHQQAFDAEIAAVLRSDDAVWKASLLAVLSDCRAGADTVRAAEHIACCPTAAERAEGADEAARDFLARRTGG